MTARPPIHRRHALQLLAAGFLLMGMGARNNSATTSGTKNMTSNLPPDGTPFYFTRRLISIRAPNNGVPVVDADTVSDYAGLALAYDYYRGILADGKLTSVETWKRSEADVPASTPIGDAPLSSFEVERPLTGLADQTPRFFGHDAATDTWAEIDYATTEGNSDFIRTYLVAIPDTKDAEIVYERIRQHLVTKTTFDYGSDGHARSMTEAHAETGFDPVTTPLPGMAD